MSDYNQSSNGADNKRQELLLTQPEVEVPDSEMSKYFSSRCTDEVIVKREVSGRLADDVRKRFGVKDNTPVFISESQANAQIGDETWEHFHSLLIECGDQSYDFESWSEGNCFTEMLVWIDQDPND